MLASNHYTPHYMSMSSAHHAFLPPVPSPLSPRSANAATQPRRITTSMSAEQENASANSTGINPKDRVTPFAKRAVKKAPSPTQCELKERRRKLFLKKVHDTRDERRFESRGDDMQRLDFYQRQRQWEAEQALSAPMLAFDSAQDDDAMAELRVSSSAMAGSTQPDEEAEELLAREDEEVAALLESFENAVDDRRSEHFGSDDEDYEALFSGLVDGEGMQRQGGTSEPIQQPGEGEGEAMDTS